MNNMRKGFTLTEVLVAGLISAVVIGLVSVALNTYNRISSKMTERAAINYEVNYVDDLCQSIVKYINADDGMTLVVEDGVFKSSDSNHSIEAKVNKIVYCGIDVAYRYITSVIFEYSSGIWKTTVQVGNETHVFTYSIYE